MPLKISSAKWRPFCLGLNELKVRLSLVRFENDATRWGTVEPLLKGHLRKVSSFFFVTYFLQILLNLEESVSLFFCLLILNTYCSMNLVIYEKTWRVKKCNMILIALSWIFECDFFFFFQPVSCDNAVETWLTSLLQSIKASLQAQMAWAMGTEKRPPPEESQPISTSRSQKQETKKGPSRRNSKSM